MADPVIIVEPSTPPSPRPAPAPAAATMTGTAGADVYDFEVMDVPFAGLLISDPGGTDTFFANFVLGDHTIDLQSAATSIIGGNRVTISAGTLIENATGGDGNDSLTGNAQANVLRGLGGNDTLDGGTGADAAVFSGARSSYTLTRTANGFTVTDTVGDEGTDTLVNIERLHFADAKVAVDTAGNGGMAYRLYQAAFDRAPDAAGLGFQMKTLDDGWNIALVAQNFIDSPEFAFKYQSLDTTQFVRQLYANVLHREADAQGLAFHVNNINTGFNTRANVLVGFSESPENQAALMGVMSAGIVFS